MAKRWYSGSVLSNFEKKIAEQKKRERESADWNEGPSQKQPRKQPTDRSAAKVAQQKPSEGKRVASGSAVPKGGKKRKT